MRNNTRSRNRALEARVASGDVVLWVWKDAYAQSADDVDSYITMWAARDAAPVLPEREAHFYLIGYYEQRKRAGKDLHWVPLPESEVAEARGRARRTQSPTCVLLRLTRLPYALSHPMEIKWPYVLTNPSAAYLVVDIEDGGCCVRECVFRRAAAEGSVVTFVQIEELPGTATADLVERASDQLRVIIPAPPHLAS